MSLISSIPGVQKLLLSGGKGPPPDLVKNCKAIFHFRTIRLLPDGSFPDVDEIKDHVIDDTQTLGTGPFELLIGREFKLGVWEQMVKSMLVNEVARFSCPYTLVSEYPVVSRALRDLAKHKTHGHHDDDHDHTHHQCGYSAMVHGTGHKDLDSLMQDKPGLAFEINLICIENPGDYKQDSWAMTDNEKMEIIPRLREEGNSFYKSGDHKAACEKYYEALSYLESLSIKEKPQSEDWNKIESIKVPFLLNYAQCQLINGDYAEVIRHTSKVLEFEPDNIKALYRRGKAHSACWNVEEAEIDLKRAAVLDSSLQKMVDKELVTLRQRVRGEEKEERDRLQGKLFK